jgi:hypothetical protein
MKTSIAYGNVLIKKHKIKVDRKYPNRNDEEVRVKGITINLYDKGIVVRIAHEPSNYQLRIYNDFTIIAQIITQLQLYKFREHIKDLYVNSKSNQGCNTSSFSVEFDDPAILKEVFYGITSMKL